MAIIHRIGTPENDSEARAIKRFGKDLPDDCFVFHNFEVTTGRGLPYEYDLAVLTPHALYHVEVKGYHGARSAAIRCSGSSRTAAYSPARSRWPTRRVRSWPA